MQPNEVLHVFEILKQIVEDVVDVAPQKEKICAMRQIVGVSRRFWDVVIPMLWVSIGELQLQHLLGLERKRLYGSFVRSLDMSCTMELPKNIHNTLPNVRNLHLSSQEIRPIRTVMELFIPYTAKTPRLNSLTVTVTVPTPVDIELGSDEEGDIVHNTKEDATQEDIHAIIKLLSSWNIIHLNIETIFHLLHETLRRNRSWTKLNWATIIKDTWFSALPKVAPSLHNAVTWRIGSGMMYVALEDLVQGCGHICHLSGGLVMPQDAMHGIPEEMLVVQEVTVRSEMESQRCSFQSFGRWAAKVSMPNLHSLQLHTIGPIHQTPFDLTTLNIRQFTSLRHLEFQLVDQDLTWECCEPLLVVTQLQELSIITIRSHMDHFYNRHMQKLARSLPNLLHLHLAFKGTDITSRSLRYLQVHCNKLMTFTGFQVEDFGNEDLQGEGEDACAQKMPRCRPHRLQILDLPDWRPGVAEASWVQDLFPSAVTSSGHAVSDLGYTS